MACGGVAVRPGDVVIADHDGVTVVPLDDAARGAARREQVAREEKRLAKSPAASPRPEIDESLRRLRK